MKGSSSFLKNALILTGTALLLRSIGMIFRVYLSGRIGAEGMGLYQMVFSVYVLAATFASSGISTAVTRLIADELGTGGRSSVLRILRRAVGVAVAVGLASAALVFFCADWIGLYWLKDARAVPALRILSLSLPFMGISSCLRGYFIACRRVTCSSNAQILEQLVRIAVIAALLARFADRGIVYACAVVLLGDTVAEAASCAFLWLGFLRDRRRLPERDGRAAPPERGVLRRLMRIAVPISAGRYLSTLLRTVESLLVPDCLTRFTRSKETSLSQFGMLKGMAMPILFFPSSFLSAFSTLLIPEISQALALGRRRKVEYAVNRSVHVTLCSSILIGGLFLLFSRELGTVLYGSEEVGFYLRVLAPLVPLMYLESVVDGILKGLDQQVSSLRYNVADSAVRIIMIILLVPGRGMLGFLLVMAVSNVLTSCLSLRRLLTVTGLPVNWREWLVKPLLSLAAAGAFGWTLSRLLAGRVAALPLLLVGIPATAAVYALMLFLAGGFTERQLRAFRVRTGSGGA